MVSVTPVINSAPIAQATLSYQSHFQKHANKQNQQNRTRRHVHFNLISMTYTKLFPALIQKNLVQARTPPIVPKEHLWWYKVDQHYAFHQGAHGHDIENCFSLQAEVKG